MRIGPQEVIIERPQLILPPSPEGLLGPHHLTEWVKTLLEGHGLRARPEPAAPSYNSKLWVTGSTGTKPGAFVLASLVPGQETHTVISEETHIPFFEITEEWAAGKETDGTTMDVKYADKYGEPHLFFEQKLPAPPQTELSDPDLVAELARHDRGRARLNSDALGGALDRARLFLSTILIPPFQPKPAPPSTTPPIA